MVLIPTVTILMTSTGRMPYMKQALDSVRKQTRQDFELLVINKGEFPLDLTIYPSNFTFIQTGESDNIKKEVCILGYIFNQAYKQGLIRGEYLCTFYDDDLYNPHFIEKMAGYLDSHPECNIVRCTQNRYEFINDKVVNSAVFKADKIILQGEQVDCKVDGGQVMIRTSILKYMPKPLMTEIVGDCAHSDGVFLENIMKNTNQMDFIDEALYEHRTVPSSNSSKENENEKL